MNYKIKLIIFVSGLILLLPFITQAQIPEGTSDRYIRVAEVGELADSVNVWGDVGDSGRYIVPEGTTLPELISFSFGYVSPQGGTRYNNFSKTLIEVKVSRYDQRKKLVEIAFFRYKYNDVEPVEMFNFDLKNNDIVTLQVSKKPSFTDYVNVIAPVVGVIATSFLLIENLRGN